jgi:hypothetical protein
MTVHSQGSESAGFSIGDGYGQEEAQSRGIYLYCVRHYLAKHNPMHAR